MPSFKREDQSFEASFDATKKDNAILSAFLLHSKKSILQLRTDEERKEASEIVLAAIEMKSSIEPQWIGEYLITLAQ